MSHFSVAVFSDGTKSVKELLKPYQENNMEDCPKEHLQFFSISKGYKKKYENGETEGVVLQDGEIIESWNHKKLQERLTYTIFQDGKNHSFYYDGKPEYLLCNTSDFILGNVQICFNLAKHGAELKKIPLKKLYPSFEIFMKDYLGVKFDKEQQNYGFWENPNAKWDWWEIGGRWKDIIMTKDGKCTQAKVKDIKFESDIEKYEESLRWWEVVVEGYPLRKGEKESEFFNVYKKEDLLNYYKNKEIYATIQSSFHTYAVVLPDEIWYQKGEILWFGLGSETIDASYEWDMKYKENFIDKANPNWTLTIVDCHI